MTETEDRHNSDVSHWERNRISGKLQMVIHNDGDIEDAKRNCPNCGKYMMYAYTIIGHKWVCTSKNCEYRRKCSK